MFLPRLRGAKAAPVGPTIAKFRAAYHGTHRDEKVGAHGVLSSRLRSGDLTPERNSLCMQASAANHHEMRIVDDRSASALVLKRPSPATGETASGDRRAMGPYSTPRGTERRRCCCPDIRPAVGLELLASSERASLPVIIATAYSDLESAVAVRAGRASGITETSDESVLQTSTIVHQNRPRWIDRNRPKPAMQRSRA